MHELLIFEGEETEMAFCPPLPEGHPRIIDLFPDKLPQEMKLLQKLIDEISFEHLFSFACWRNYLGTWEIKDGRFFLIGLRGRFKLQGEEPLLADWFSGVIRIPKGEMLLYVHMGFGSVFEQEVHVKIERGLVVKSRIIDNRNKKHNWSDLGLKNLPGRENRFPGDDEL
jgi:hypothetical protein